jgi:hypothetical protein
MNQAFDIPSQSSQSLLPDGVRILSLDPSEKMKKKKRETLIKTDRRHVMCVKWCLLRRLWRLEPLLRFLWIIRCFLSSISSIFLFLLWTYSVGLNLLLRELRWLPPLPQLLIERTDGGRLAL